MHDLMQHREFAEILTLLLLLHVDPFFGLPRAKSRVRLYSALSGRSSEPSLLIYLTSTTSLLTTQKSVGSQPGSKIRSVRAQCINVCGVQSVDGLVCSLRFRDYVFQSCSCLHIFRSEERRGTNSQWRFTRGQCRQRSGKLSSSPAEP